MKNFTKDYLTEFIISNTFKIQNKIKVNMHKRLFSTVKKWAAEFKHNHMSINDAECLDRPKIAASKEII